MKLVVINGAPTVGKDEFVNQCRAINPNIINVSTVDKIKEIAREFGWDGTKTPKNRKFLADLKDLTTAWNDVPYHDVMRTIELKKAELRNYDMPSDDWITFIHCREPQEIDKFVKRNGAITLGIKRKAVDQLEQSNQADRGVYEYNYDYIINNDGTIHDLYNAAEWFLKTINEEC